MIPYWEGCSVEIRAKVIGKRGEEWDDHLLCVIVRNGIFGVDPYENDLSYWFSVRRSIKWV